MDPSILREAVAQGIAKLRQITPTMRLAWLLEFCQRSPQPDDNIGIAVFLLSEQPKPQWSWREGASEALTPAVIETLASKIHDGVVRFMNRQPWRVETGSISARVLLPLRPGLAVSDHYEGEPADAMLWSAVDLIKQLGSDIRRCARKDDCGKFFLPSHHGQEYCSKRCSLLERTRRYRTKTPKAELSEKRHKLYLNKLAREKHTSIEKLMNKVRRRIPQKETVPVQEKPGRETDGKTEPGKK